MTRGIAPVQITQEAAIAKQEEIRPRILNIEDKLFSEFAEVNIENEAFFTYITYYLMMQFLEKVEDLNWVLQFPARIPS